MSATPDFTPLAPTAARRGRWSVLARWWAVLGLATALTVLLAAVAAGLLSRSMWGYVFTRPALHARVLSAREVVSVTPVEQLEQPNGSWRLLPSGEAYGGPGWYEQEKAAWPREFDYYLLDRRPLLALERAGVLNAAVPSLAAAELPDLDAMLRPVLAAEQLGYDRTLRRPTPGRPMHGTLYELVGARGERLVLLAISGSAVSNDHYPYYELLYEDQPPRGLTLVGTNRFYFDLAGLEGVEFPQIFVAFALMGLVVVVPVVSIFLAYRRFSAWGAVRRGQCPVCRYDLGGHLAAGCPECGWGRGERVPAERDLPRYTPVGTLARLAARPPSWVTFALALAASWMILLGWSTPGRHPGWMSLGILAWFVAAALLVVKLSIWAVQAARRAGTPARLRWLRVAAVVALAGLTYWATTSDAALRWRFLLSRPAMDRLAAGLPYAPGTAPKQAGLYRVHNVFQHGQVVFVLVSGSSLHYCNGFVCFPGGKPEHPTAYGKPLECTPIAGGWYMWRYIDP